MKTPKKDLWEFIKMLPYLVVLLAGFTLIGLIWLGINLWVAVWLDRNPMWGFVTWVVSLVVAVAVLNWADIIEIRPRLLGWDINLSALLRPSRCVSIRDNEAPQETLISRHLVKFPEHLRVAVNDEVVLRIPATDLKSRVASQIGMEDALKREALISPVMRASLRGDSLEIEPMNSEEQMIPSFGFAEWVWRITPRKAGELPVWISVALVCTVDGTKTAFDLPPWRHSVRVQSNFWGSVKVFWKKHWQWIIGLLIGNGLLLFWLGKKLPNAPTPPLPVPTAQSAGPLKP